MTESWELWLSWEEEARMFFSLILRNSRRNRRENGIFFASLIIAIVAFYIILSLENQDVMKFLMIMESDAVSRILQLVPVLYGGSLFLVFFLIYFAGKYQLERRNHEFGIYLMMGMKRSRLLFLLLAEDIWSSIISLLVGIPVAIALSELISLVTSKLVGLGIIGHQFTFSWKAVGFTFLGFMCVKILAFIILSWRIVRSEISDLLENKQREKQRVVCGWLLAVKLMGGILLLGSAYTMAVRQVTWRSVENMGITVVLGIAGTFLVFAGSSALVELWMKKKSKKGLHVFTFRQLQENVLLRSNSLAVSSLLILMALCCFGYGISVGWINGAKETHVMDFTFNGEEEKVRTALEASEVKGYVDTLFPMKMGMISTTNESVVRDGVSYHTLNPEQLLRGIESLEESREKEILENNYGYFESPYLIALSGYNEVLKLQGKEAISLGENQIGLYTDSEFAVNNRDVLMKEVLEQKPSLLIDDKEYQLLPTLFHDSLVVDRLITILHGLIVPDELFVQLVEQDNVSTYWNMKLNETFVEEEGLMQAIYQVNDLLKNKGLEYESYLQNMGRQMFYVVASSYITLYLAIIFLIISNTVLGTQFLMQQKKTAKRYRTLMVLGSTYKSIRHSARAQIRWYFGLPVALALVSSMFGIQSLFSGLLPSSLQGEIFSLGILGLAIICILFVVECIYMIVVMGISDRHILELMEEGKR